MNGSLADVAIIGGGYLGSALARALQPPVLVTTRSGMWRDGEPPVGVRVVPLDITSPSLDPSPLQSARALVMCYAPGRTQDRRALYVEGTRRVLEATSEARLRRIIYVGSTSALPDLDGWVDESCTAWPTSERGRVQREAEAVVTEHCERHGIPHWILRLAGLYGPGRGLERIYTTRAPSEPMAGDGSAATNLIHRDDAVSSIIAALEASPDHGGIVHVVDDDHRSRRQMYDAIAQFRGVAPVDWERPASSDTPSGKRVSNERLKNVLGVRLRFPSHVLDESL